MAILKADNYTKQENPTSDNIVSPGTLGGRVRVLVDEITLAAAQIADVIKFGKDLQDGAIILGIEVNNAALGGASTMNIGDADTEDRYMAAIDLNTASVKRDLAQAGDGYKIGTNDGDNTIQGVIAGAAATGLLKIKIFYTED